MAPGVSRQKNNYFIGQAALIRCLLTIALPWWRCKAYFDRLSQNEDNKEKEFSKASIVSVWLDGEVVVSLR